MTQSSREAWSGARATKPPGALILPPSPVILGKQSFPDTQQQAVCSEWAYSVSGPIQL